MSTDQTSVTNTLRRLGGKGPEVSAIGVGTWALGGPYTLDGRDAGWGPADDQVSIRALHTAIDHGVTLIDTAASYGAGHSERVVGQALAQLSSDARDRIVVATKFGFVFDEQTRTAGGSDVSPAAIRAECEASLRRLGVEAIGLYQLHGGADGARGAEDVVAVLEDLVREGKIRWFGTSQDAPEIISVFARSPHAVSVQGPEPGDHSAARRPDPGPGRGERGGAALRAAAARGRRHADHAAGRLPGAAPVATPAVATRP